MTRTKQFTVYVSEPIKKRIDDLSTKKRMAIPELLANFLDLNDKHDLLDPEWKTKLINSEFGEDIKKGLVKEIEKGIKEDGIGELTHNCSFLCPFVDKKDNIVCMRIWKEKSRILKIPLDVCNLCNEKGYVIQDIAKPLTEMERLEREQAIYQKKREEYHKATLGGGLTFDQLSTKAKEREERKDFYHT